MSYVVVKNFKAGLDRRGSQVGGDPGSLWDACNVLINRKGEIERRKKFVSTYTLPADTFGMHATGSTLRVFGSAAAPVVPSGVAYQRLQHPDGSTAMSKVLSAENFDGKPYVVAKFADNGVYHFYDGALVPDWYVGIVRADMTNNDGIAEHLKALIDASADYSATRSGAVITVTGAANVAFDTETSVENGGATDNQAIATATTQTAVEDVIEVRATGAVTVTAGASATAATGSVELTGGASGSVDSVTVNGVTVTSGAVPFNSSLDQTATDLAANITAHTSSPEYTAAAVGAVVTISAAASAGAAPNGYVVASSVTTITKTDVNMASGANKGISSVKADGVEVLGAQVNYTTSNSILAAALAAQINTYTSSPEYSATASGPTVTIRAAAGTGDGLNGALVAVTADSGVTATTANMAGGVDAVTGQPQKNTFTISGTFEVGDKFNVALGDESFGYVGNPLVRGAQLLTHKAKMYTVSGSLAQFSGVNNAASWNRDSVEYPGANYINLASQDEGSQTLYGLGQYQGNLAFFARNAVQVWAIFADEDSNTLLQTLKNTGSRSGGTILGYGNDDLFYYADSGFRSLRARDSSNAAYVNDVGTAIDPFVKEYAKTLTDAQIEDAIAVLQPDDDRYWAALGTNRVFVFNYFPGSKISAWTYFDTTDDVGGQITAWARIAEKLYARAGDTIFLYGGSDGDTYPEDDEAVATVELPFLDADRPGSEKTVTGVGLGCTGQWLVALLVEPTDTSAYVTIGRFTKSSFKSPGGAGEHRTTHFAPKMVCSQAGPATLNSIIVFHNELSE